MRCSYHPEVESREACTICKKYLCEQCTHTIKGKAYCEDCLVHGAEWAYTIKDLRLPTDAPKRAALCALIPGLGAVYNNEYMKAITYFAVWAALAALGFRISGIFGFGAFVFLIFTMFDAYRSAEAKLRKRLVSDEAMEEPPRQEKAFIAWGIFLIVLGALFLLQNFIPYYYLRDYWPLIFILLGVFLVYFSLRKNLTREHSPTDWPRKSKEDF
jgi:hypothetical protein